VIIDLWHFPCTELEQQVLALFVSGLSNALVFFAPRRMGKTEKNLLSNSVLRPCGVF